jgi:hypothetical protein
LIAPARAWVDGAAGLDLSWLPIAAGEERKMAPSTGSDEPSTFDYAVREAVGLFHSEDELEDAIEALELAGFDRAQINLLAAQRSAEERLRHRITDQRELEDSDAAPLGVHADRHEVAEGKAALVSGLALVGSFAAIGAVVATGGGLAAVIAAAAVAGGAGGGIGGLIARTVGQHRAQEIEAQLAAGGLLLWVELRSPEQEQKAIEILKRHSAADVHVHELRRHWGDEDVPLRRWQPDPFLAP